MVERWTRTAFSGCNLQVIVHILCLIKPLGEWGLYNTVVHHHVWVLSVHWVQCFYEAMLLDLITVVLHQLRDCTCHLAASHHDYHTPNLVHKFLLHSRSQHALPHNALNCCFSPHCCRHLGVSSPVSSPPAGRQRTRVHPHFYCNHAVSAFFTL